AAILVNFTGKRIESVGTFGAPNSVEKPPLLLDFVYSRIFEIWGGEYKFSLEVRNILGEDFELTQGPIITETYSLGTTVQLGITASY
ncbi:MAG: hypothetical protein R3360_02315, partial [Alphaproteobacteria bacterium]|nr:hypothetical protein [Alphaproteobacteria bacterium]